MKHPSHVATLAILLMFSVSVFGTTEEIAVPEVGQRITDGISYSGQSGFSTTKIIDNRSVLVQYFRINPSQTATVQSEQGIVTSVSITGELSKGVAVALVLAGIVPEVGQPITDGRSYSGRSGFNAKRIIDNRSVLVQYFRINPSQTATVQSEQGVVTSVSITGELSNKVVIGPVLTGNVQERKDAAKHSKWRTFGKGLAVAAAVTIEVSTIAMCNNLRNKPVIWMTVQDWNNVRWCADHGYYGSR